MAVAVAVGVGYLELRVRQHGSRHGVEVAIVVGECREVVAQLRDLRRRRHVCGVDGRVAANPSQRRAIRADHVVGESAVSRQALVPPVEHPGVRRLVGSSEDDLDHRQIVGDPPCGIACARLLRDRHRLGRCTQTLDPRGVRPLGAQEQVGKRLPRTEMRRLQESEVCGGSERERP